MRSLWNYLRATSSVSDVVARANRAQHVSTVDARQTVVQKDWDKFDNERAAAAHGVGSARAALADPRGFLSTQLHDSADGVSDVRKDWDKFDNERASHAATAHDKAAAAHEAAAHEHRGVESSPYTAAAHDAETKSRAALKATTAANALSSKTYAGVSAAEAVGHATSGTRESGTDHPTDHHFFAAEAHDRAATAHREAASAARAYVAAKQ